MLGVEILTLYFKKIKKKKKKKADRPYLKTSSARKTGVFFRRLNVNQLPTEDSTVNVNQPSTEDSTFYVNQLSNGKCELDVDMCNTEWGRCKLSVYRRYHGNYNNMENVYQLSINVDSLYKEDNTASANQLNKEVAR